MPTAQERRGHECLDTGQRHLATDDAGAHRKDVGVVVFAAEPGRDRIGRLHATDAADLVGNDGLAGAAAAHHDAEVALAGGNRARRRSDVVRIVDRLGRIDTEVDDLVAGQGEPFGDWLFQREAGVIGRQGNAHDLTVANGAEANLGESPGWSKVGAMLNSTFRLFTIRGIEVGVHYSWLIIFALVSFSLSVYIFPSVPGIPRMADLEFWVLGVLTAVLLFASVLVHELAHSFVALARGLKAKSITLFIFGGVSNLSGDSKDSSTEFLVAIVGPLTSFALAAISFALASAIDEPRASLVFSYLFFINLTLGIFNLVPGFPLDGGRVLRAILWRVTGNVRRATVWAANVGRLVALLMFGYAAYLLVVENSVIGAVWTAAIAWFLYTAASGSVQQLVFEQRLKRVHVGDAITRDEVTVTPDITVADLVDRYLLPAARTAMLASTIASTA